MNDVQNTNEILQRHAAVQLSNELAFFHEHKHEWMAAHHGEFILLGKQVFGGFYKTHAEAMRAGIRMFGPVRPFLVEQILEEEM
jgi:hypothetical protein